VHWVDGFGSVVWIVRVLVWALIIVGVVVPLRWLRRAGTGSRDAQRKAPLEILQERYARGEIGREEYELKRRDIEG
jgi:putative membrane protein